MNESTLGNFKPIFRLDLERFYEFDIEQVWEAITAPEQVSAWMEYPVSIDLKVGGEIYFDFGSEGQIKGVVCSLEPHRVFTYTWGDSLVKWHLVPEGKHTKATFSHIGLTSENAVELGSGWHAFIDYLEPYLKKADFPKNQHSTLVEGYQRKFDTCRQ